jgi:hypothetical protein
MGRIAVFAATLRVAASHLSAVAQEDTIRVLWVGNSHTDVGGIWYNWVNMVNCDTCGTEPGVYAQVVPCLWPSSNLQYDYDEGPALQIVDTGHFDCVLLQDMQGNVFWGTGRDRIYTYTGLFSDTVRATGGECVTFYNWIWEGARQDQQDYPVSFFDSVVAAHSTIPMPAGVAWWSAVRERPELEWFDPQWSDGNHPGYVGAYPNTCIAYAVLTRSSPVGSRWRLVPPHGWDQTYHFSESDATWIQHKAWDAYLEYFSTTSCARQRS